jgi:hypothetical protein
MWQYYLLLLLLHFNYLIILIILIIFCSGRKRRGSESAMSDSSSDDYFYSMLWSHDDHRCNSPLVMSECTAAMVLMNLSCSPTAVKLRAAKAAASSAVPARPALQHINGDRSSDLHQSDSTSKTCFFLFCVALLLFPRLPLDTGIKFLHISGIRRMFFVFSVFFAY